MPREVIIYNTLSGKKEPLVPESKHHVRMYACGITPYDECHIGHAMQGIFFDIIRNYLEYADYQVTYVRNFTDVDDKIIERAAKLGKTPQELSSEMIRSSQEDMAALGIRPASFEPKVSESINEIIQMIESIIAAGGGYASPEGDVYYRVRHKKDYGKLSNRKPDELLSGTRELTQGSKEDSADFALWKHDETEGASWDSPWGQGRPGWHIECSAMAKTFLGDRNSGTVSETDLRFYFDSLAKQSGDLQSHGQRYVEWAAFRQMAFRLPESSYQAVSLAIRGILEVARKQQQNEAEQGPAGQSRKESTDEALQALYELSQREVAGSHSSPAPPFLIPDQL